MSYAEDTKVSVEKSRAELDTMLQRAGAHQRIMGNDDVNGTAFVGFAIGTGADMRQVRLTVPLPKFDTYALRPARAGARDQRPTRLTAEQQTTAYEQATRSRWRAVVLLVKAKLEAVELGVSTIEREFLADIYLPSGETVAQHLGPKLAAAYLSGSMPPMLGMGSAQGA